MKKSSVSKPQNAWLPLLSLFASASTLVCCALPALLVALGLGASLAGLVSHLPGLIWMSERKLGFFVFAGVMLAAAGVAQYRARNLPCPIDPELARACTSTRRWSAGIYFASVSIYLVGALFAFGFST